MTSGHQRRSQSRRFWLLLGTHSLLLSAIWGCSRAEIPFAAEEWVQLTATQSKVETLVAEETPESTPEPENTVTYSVVWVPEDTRLTVHDPAGIAGTVIDELGREQGGILLTENRTRLGTSEWVEIQLPGGRTGWVNAWNLTEEIPNTQFCRDPRIEEILEEFQKAVGQEDGRALLDLVNNKRGLSIRHDWWNAEVRIPYDIVPDLFDTPQDFNWGAQIGSALDITGSFRQIILPRLENVFSFPTESACNQLKLGISNNPADWPSEYSTLNYYSIHRPAPASGNGRNWRTWALGFEYISGIPYVAVIVQYSAES